MSIITHGSDVSLAPTVRPIVKQLGGSLKSALVKLTEAGFQSVQLDATMAGLRPRDLDRTGRRDLIATLGRRSLRLAGLDLFIPRKHFAEAENMDRAVGAALAGIELAADLGRVPVSIALPVKSLTDETTRTLAQAADGCDVRLAVHAEDQLDELRAWLTGIGIPAVGAAIDPASLIALGHKPVTVASELGAQLAVARLNDFQITAGDEGDDHVAGVRCAVGEGELNVMNYRVMLDLARHRAGPVVLDLRNMENALQAAEQGLESWNSATFSL